MGKGGWTHTEEGSFLILQRIVLIEVAEELLEAGDIPQTYCPFRLIPASVGLSEAHTVGYVDDVSFTDLVALQILMMIDA